MKTAVLSIKFKGDENHQLIEQISEAFKSLDIKLSVVVRDLEKWGEIKFSPSELMEKNI